MRRSKAIRAAAWGAVAAGLLAPLVRRRLQTPPLLSQVLACSAPIGLSVAVRRSRGRDVAVCCLQMWAYLLAYKMPHDDPLAQARRARIDYPIAVDRVLGLGELPTVRLQRALAGVDSWSFLDRVLVWTHWVWFAVPHGSVAYILWRRPERFPRAAAITYAVFDIGAIAYWILPTAPPWYAALHARHLAQEGAREDREAGRAGQGAAWDGPGGTPAGQGAAAERVDPLVVAIGRPQRGLVSEPMARRMMAEYGEFFWKDNWGRLYSVLGGNPLAAMPSLHFATSATAALLLTELGPVPGALGWGYTLTLGFALVYLGEHYLVDLLAGAALAGGVRRLGPRAGPVLQGFRHALARLEEEAHAAG